MENNSEQSYTSLPFYGIPRLVPYVKPYAKLLFSMVLLGFLSSLMEAAFPLFNRYAINNYIYGKSFSGMPVFIASYFLLILLIVANDYITMFFACKVEIGVGKDLKNKAFSHLQTLSFSYFNNHNVGYIHSRVMSDTSKIAALVAGKLMDMIWSGSYLIFMILMMFIVEPKLAFYLTLLVPVTTIIIMIFQKRVVVLHRKIREINSRITSKFNEGITGAKSIKILAVEDKVEDEFVKETAFMRLTSVSAEKYSSIFMFAVLMMSSAALGIVLWEGGILTISQVMEIGTLSMFFIYAVDMMEPIQVIIETITSLIQIQVNIERVTNLINTESDVADTEEVIEKYGNSFNPKKENWEELHGDIEFKDVSFKYPDGDDYILEHFNLKVMQGTNVAIVGETGAGKSTLVNLVCRFFEPTSGKLLIDGRDARERSLLWLHSNIGYVLQTPHLFSGTVRDNLKYGNPSATDEEIMAALRLVSADRIVASMEKGLDSDVGEGGNQLSTGGKQLLSFARAILSDPRILVLDEATSSIDTVTEKKIQDAIKVLTDGRTSFVIAHRLSTIVGADVILVVQDGKITERGTHKELMKNKGYYYELYSRQFEEMVINNTLDGR